MTPIRLLPALLCLLSPGLVPTPAQAGATAGPGTQAAPRLKLDRVVMLARHGVRAPLNGEVPDGTRTATPWPRWPRWPVPQSHLTGRGAQAMAIAAKADRRAMAAAGLLPATGCPRPGQVRIHTNTAERTIASGDAFIRGFAPGCAIPVDHLPEGVTDPIFEPLNAHATRFDAAQAVAAIDRFTGGVEALARRHAPTIALLDRTLGCGLPAGCSPVAPSRVTPSADGRGIDLSGPIRITSGTAQVLLLQYAEGLPVRDTGPQRLDADTLQRLGSLHAALFDVFSRSPYMASHQAAVLGLRMLTALTRRDGPILDVLVGHDTNVTALAAALRVDLIAPGYAANDVAPGGALMLERLHDEGTGRAYVRLSYRTQSPTALRTLSDAVTVTPLRIPGCGGTDLCDLATFERLLRSRLADVPLRMNDVQVVGSHNSFKAQIPAPVMTAIRARDPKAAAGLDYYHLPLSEQLDRGVRQIEIDIFADPTGGRYADPKGEAIARAAGAATGFDRAAMLRPGYKVLHVPDIDYRSTCITLIRCLGEIDRWSRAHPRHLPIMVTVNAADTPADEADITVPLPLDDAGRLDALDAEIRSVLPGRRLITPDDVRGSDATLRDAVRTHGWPTLETARGRIFLVLDVRDAVSEAYRAGHPSLAGRAMFGWFPDDQAESAVQIVQDPLADGDRIRRWVEQGMFVRTRTDANTVEARAQDHRKAIAAANSGAQALSTDYYPGAPDPADLHFRVTLPGSVMERCNPVRRSEQDCVVGDTARR